MQIKKVIENVRNFIDLQIENGKVVKIFEKNAHFVNFFAKCIIKVGLDSSKEIILQEETGLELGGANKKSFSLIYPTDLIDIIRDGKITLIGPEIKDIKALNIDYGILILIGFKKITEKEFENLKQFNFISNGIEGFMIRTIPRKFWCRINTAVLKKKFSFEFFGNAIMYLYQQKFNDLIKSIEVIMINSDPDLIDKLVEITSELREESDKKWKEKIETWKKRAGCDYDWDCQECPYTETCDEVKNVLDAREKLEK